MDIKEIQAWRTIVAILRETGYDKLYDEEVHTVAECLHRCEQQCKKQKEVIDKAIEKINDYKIYCEKNKGLTEYTDIEIEAIEPVISELEDILNEGKNE